MSEKRDQFALNSVPEICWTGSYEIKDNGLLPRTVRQCPKFHLK